MLESIVARINESDLSATAFLRSIDTIEDQDIQECCRKATIAQMYNAKLDYRSGYPYVATSANSREVLMLCFKNSTAVVSKYGELIFDEGDILANPHDNRGGMGWRIRKVIDGQVSNKYGFITSAGKRVLPCVFSDLDPHIGELSAIYNRVPFDVIILGAVDDVEKEEMEYMIDLYDAGIFCLSEDSILFSLLPLTNVPEEIIDDEESLQLLEEKEKEAINDVKSLLSSIVLSKERLQEIMDSK